MDCHFPSSTLPPPPPLPSAAVTITEPLQSALECGLCLSLICEPISASCGHTFCRTCLVTSLRREKKKCPLCRAICHISAEDANENIMIKNLAKLIDPVLYAQRQKEADAEKASWSSLLPIFYYNVAMFPGQILSLHLFEPRYRLMMRRIVDTSRSFAYVPNFTSYRASPGDIALIAELKEVEFLPDGRCLIEAALASRQKIIDHFVEEGTQGLHFCRLEPLNDISVDESGVELSQLMSIARTFVSFIMQGSASSKIAKMYGSPPTATVSSLSLWLTSVLPLDSMTKLRLLASTDSLDRLRTCIVGIQQTIPSLQSPIGDNEANQDSDEDWEDEEFKEEL